MKIPETYCCNKCGEIIILEKLLDHIEQVHETKVFRRICNYTPIYNDAKAWNRGGYNILKHGLFNIIIDVRFPGFPKIRKTDYSTDGTDDLVESYPNTLYLRIGESFEENASNFAYHIAAKMGFEFVLRVDSDEYIEGNVGSLLQDLDKRLKDLPKLHPQVFNIAFVEHSKSDHFNVFRTEHERIFYMPGLLRMRHLHYFPYSAVNYIESDGRLYPQIRRIPGEKTVIIHQDDSIRDKKRNKLMLEFQDYDVPRERKNLITKVFKNDFEPKIFLSSVQNYHKFRSYFLKSDCTHIMICDYDYDVTKKIFDQFKEVLSFHIEIDILSAVFKLSEKNWRLTYILPGVQFLTTKQKEIHNCSSDNGLFPITLTLGPIFVMSREVASKFDDVSDKSALLKNALSQGFRAFCDSEIKTRIHNT